MADEMEGCFGGIVMFVLIAVAVSVGVMALFTFGSLYGAGSALKNYYLAFRNNVRPERAKA